MKRGGRERERVLDVNFGAESVVVLLHLSLSTADREFSLSLSHPNSQTSKETPTKKKKKFGFLSALLTAARKKSWNFLYSYHGE